MPNNLLFLVHFQSVRHFFPSQMFYELIYKSVCFYENRIVFNYAIVKNHNPSVCNIKINYSDEDFKMKKLLLNLLVVMSNNSAVVQVRHMVQVHVMISVNAVQILNRSNNPDL